MRFRDIALKNFAFVVDRSPQVVGLPVDLYEDLIQVPLPLPLRDLTYERGALHADFAREHWSEAGNPKPDALMADIDAAFVEQVLDVTQ